MKAVRIFKFDAAHRIVGHEGKCRTIHGHTYVLHAYVETNKLDQLGRVVDFSDIKKKLGAWIDMNFDHNVIIWKEDPNIELLTRCDGAKLPFVTDFNPTAENLAIFLLNTIFPEILLNSSFRVTKIKLFETENCYVECELAY